MPNCVVVTPATVAGPSAKVMVSSERPQSSSTPAPTARTRSALGTAMLPESSATGRAMSSETVREIAVCESQSMSP